MSSRRFDTLETARELEATGIERVQAEAIAQAIGRDGERLATRDDIERLDAARKSDIERLEARMASKEDIARLESRTASKEDLRALESRTAAKSDLERLRAELYRALWIQGGSIVAIVAALKFLP